MSKPIRTALALAALLAIVPVALAASSDPTASEAPAPATVDDPTFTLSGEAAPIAIGADGTVTISFAAKKPYHWNKEYPAKVKVADGATSVAVPKREYKQTKGEFTADEHAASVKVGVKGQTEGKDLITFDTQFSVCNDTMCLIKKASVKVPVTVVTGQ